MKNVEEFTQVFKKRGFSSDLVTNRLENVEIVKARVLNTHCTLVDLIDSIKPTQIRKILTLTKIPRSIERTSKCPQFEEHSIKRLNFDLNSKNRLQNQIRKKLKTQIHREKFTNLLSPIQTQRKI